VVPEPPVRAASSLACKVWARWAVTNQKCLEPRRPVPRSKQVSARSAPLRVALETRLAASVPPQTSPRASSSALVCKASSVLPSVNKRQLWIATACATTYTQRQACATRSRERASSKTMTSLIRTNSLEIEHPSTYTSKDVSSSQDKACI